jgi:hypothetical protein
MIKPPHNPTDFDLRVLAGAQPALLSITREDDPEAGRVPDPCVWYCEWGGITDLGDAYALLRTMAERLLAQGVAIGHLQAAITERNAFEAACRIWEDKGEAWTAEIARLREAVARHERANLDRAIAASAVTVPSTTSVAVPDAPPLRFATSRTGDRSNTLRRNGGPPVPVNLEVVRRYSVTETPAVIVLTWHEAEPSIAYTVRTLDRNVTFDDDPTTGFGVVTT